MATIDKIVFSQNTPAKNTLWARPSEKGTELLIFNKGKWGTVGADDFQRFHYEVYSSLEDITEPKPNALYLIGPKGEGEDKYDEYVYTEEGFTKIGDTSIDMSDVIKYSKNSDDSYTLKAEGTEIKKLKTTDDSTVILGDNNSIEFGASGTINIGSGTLNVIGGVINASGTLLKMSNTSITGNINATGASLSGVAINNGIFNGSTQMGPVLISGIMGDPFPTLTVRFLGDDFGKVDMISCVLKTSGVELKSGGILTFGDGTTMSTAPGTTDYNDLTNKPTKVSQFENDANYLTQHQDISGKEDVTTIVAPVNTTDATLPITSLACEVGKYYRIDVAVDTLAVTLPAMTDLTTVRTVVIYLTGGTTPAITISSTAVSGGTAPDVYYHDGFGFVAGKTYEVNALFNGSAWVISSVKIIIPTTNNEE